MSGNLQSLPPPATLTSAGAQPQTPAALLAQLTAIVTAAVPGYTNDIPGALIEDLSSTAIAGVILVDQARVEALNSVSPYTANPFMLAQIAAALGIPPQGSATNGTVNVILTGPPGYVFGVGFTVSDGTNQYALNDGGIIGTDGQTQPLTATCGTAGTFAIPANTVTQIVTSIPSTVTPTPTVNNPLAGTPGGSGETDEAFRARVLQAQQVGPQGSPAMLKTLLFDIPGVVQQQVSVRSIYGGWEIICGGGDAYLIAGAIYQAMPNPANIVGSQIGVAAVTQANPGQVTTLINHGYSTGQVVTFSGVGGMTELNTGSYTIAVIDEKNFTIGVNTTSYAAFTSGGQVLPNPRNVTVTVTDGEDSYQITFVQPPQQTVSVQLVWNTNEPNFVASTSVAQLGVPGIVNYINGIQVGQPINLQQLTQAFTGAISTILPVQYLSEIQITVEINGIAASPGAGSTLIFGDPESYFYATAASVTVTQAV